METQNLRRSQKKVITNEVTSLKKMRELKGLSRKDAAPLVGVTFKLIEQLENGRVELTKKKIAQYCRAYGFTEKQYRDICEGKIGKVQKEICKVRTKVIENNNLRRSYKKLITKEAQVLKVLRQLKTLLSIKQVVYVTIAAQQLVTLKMVELNCQIVELNSL